MKKETAEALLKAGQLVAKQLELGEVVAMRVCNQTEPSACDKQCEMCEYHTHHWVGAISQNDNESLVWHCEHCDHELPQENTSAHPSGCDCPDCLLNNEYEQWLCACGNFIEDGLHCSSCGAEPPWGCPCSFCQDGDYDEDDDEDW